MNKKDMIIVALATFCLTATLFTVLPSKSGIPYDPWADVSGPTQGTEDGTVNMRDINYLIQMFGQSGSTTKDVSVTNWPAQIAGPPYAGYVSTINVSWSNYTEVFSAASFVPCGGFSRLFIHLRLFSLSAGGNTTIYLNDIAWNVTGAVGASYEQYGPQMGNVTVESGIIVSPSCVIEVRSKADWIDGIHLMLKSSRDSGWVELGVCLFLRNE